MASPLRERGGTTKYTRKPTRTHRPRQVSIDRTLHATHMTNLEPLLDFLHEHVAISSKAVDGKDSLVRSAMSM